MPIKVEVRDGNVGRSMMQLKRTLIREGLFKEIKNLEFSSIVCDPPYGVRARSQKAGVRQTKKIKEKKEPADEETEQPHFA